MYSASSFLRWQKLGSLVKHVEVDALCILPRGPWLHPPRPTPTTPKGANGSRRGRTQRLQQVRSATPSLTEVEVAVVIVHDERPDEGSHRSNKMCTKRCGGIFFGEGRSLVLSMSSAGTIVVSVTVIFYTWRATSVDLSSARRLLTSRSKASCVNISK